MTIPRPKFGPGERMEVKIGNRRCFLWLKKEIRVRGLLFVSVPVEPGRMREELGRTEDVDWEEAVLIIQAAVTKYQLRNKWRLTSNYETGGAIIFTFVR
ncbi:MAG: hypothetical protein V1716_05215 [Candidatus Uhrbacteria bacterium]